MGSGAAERLRAQFPRPRAAAHRTGDAQSRGARLDREGRVGRADRHPARLGVTTVYEGHAMGRAEIGAYQALRADGALTLRVLTTLEAESYGLPWTRPLSMAEFRENLEGALAMDETADDLLRHHGVTLSRGGPCWPGFLRMWEPYRGPWGEPTSGVEFVGPEKEAAALDFCAERGLRLNFIGAGHRDHDEFLDRCEAVARRIPVADRGWILQHVFFLTERNARRYRI